MIYATSYWLLEVLCFVIVFTATAALIMTFSGEKSAVYARYLAYVLKHKLYVFMACVRFGIPWLGIVHDLNKFLPDEFLHYARWFYGDAENEEEFKRAWFKHMRRTKHHWQCWLLVSLNSHSAYQTIDIPERYCKEMVADWIAMSSGDVAKAAMWYTDNMHKMALHSNTRKYIEQLLLENL